MATPTVDEPMVQELLDADIAFAAAIRKAIEDFRASPPPDWQQWPTYRKPEVWEQRVLPHVDSWRKLSEEALRQLRAGNVQPAYQAGLAQTGLAKTLDFNLDWATPENRQAIEETMDRVDTAADRIRRIEYAQRTGTQP